MARTTRCCHREDLLVAGLAKSGKLALEGVEGCVGQSGGEEPLEP
ncbi:hypothetical protein [Streptomyces sp. NWU339]|nr:hypothetical protein [Streptomyces sp. NWU339]